MAEALAEALDNLDHRRSPLIGLTELGRRRYAAVDRRQIRWINELAAGLAVTDLAAAARVLRELSRPPGNQSGTARKGGRPATP